MITREGEWLFVTDVIEVHVHPYLACFWFWHEDYYQGDLLGLN